MFYECLDILHNFCCVPLSSWDSDGARDLYNCFKKCVLVLD